MKNFILAFIGCFAFASGVAQAQVMVGSNSIPQAFSLLELDASTVKGGLRLPQLTTTERDALTGVTGNITTAPGLTIYNTTTSLIEYWDGIRWTHHSTGMSTFTAVNGTNADCDMGTSSFVKIIGTTAGFSISGVAGGYDGRIITLYNSTANNMTILNDATSIEANRILTLTGIDLYTTAAGTITLQYDAESARWIIIASQL
ncbi:MAG: hypothetical protein P4L28_07560 [Paludibacteraceae bacterium]|nr:hypothetical protein [Paludibacteraceae bacterium]